MAFTLQKEWDTYQALKPSLLPQERGRYVLIHGDKLVGLFDDEMEAIYAGYRQLGNVGFLVHEIQEEEIPETIVVDLWAE